MQTPELPSTIFTMPSASTAEKEDNPLLRVLVSASVGRAVTQAELDAATAWSVTTLVRGDFTASGAWPDICRSLRTVADKNGLKLELT